MRTLRLFISSPGDVERERQCTKRIVDRIACDYASLAELKPYFWEHEPHDPSSDFTTSIGPTSDYEIVVVILWSRLGNRLHTRHLKKNGEPFASGTEYEVITALEAQEVSPDRLPRLAVFLNNSPVNLELSAQEDGQTEEKLRQYRLLKAFVAEHFQDRESAPDGSEILTNKRAYTSYRTLDQFEELLEKALRSSIEEILAIQRGSQPSNDSPKITPSAQAWQGNPYQGLEVFEERHRPIYFGRSRDIGKVLERLRERFESGKGFLLVFGASGSGKSSLLRAGVLPLATAGGVIPGVGLWRQAVLKPSDGGADPFAALAAALLSPGALPELADDGPQEESIASLARANLAERLRGGPAAVGARIEECLRGIARVERELQAAKLQSLSESFEREGRSADSQAARLRKDSLEVPRAGLFLVVDQMEELYTAGASNLSRDAFLDAIHALSRVKAVIVVATLRSDYYAECEAHQGIMDLKEGDGSFHLAGPTRVELGQMIREPARAAGVRFEEDEMKGLLDERILTAAADEPDSLPVLEFCLWKLYEVGCAEGILTHHKYEEIGELSGVLSQHAEEVFSTLDTVEQGSLEEVIRAIATLGRGDHREVGDNSDEIRRPVSSVVRRVVPYVDLIALPGAKGLVDQFIAKRLLTGGLDTEGRRVVSVTHEALLREWDRVSAWLGLDENHRFLAVRARVGQRLAQWEESGRDASFLLQGGRELAEAEDQYAAFPLAFHEEERNYILTSRAQAREAEKRRSRTRRAVMMALSVLTFGAVVAGIWAGVKQREAVIERDQSRHNEGLGWLLRAEVAEERGLRYPDTLLYAAQAIGFEGVGRPADLGGEENPVRFLREDRDPGEFHRAREWIAKRPAYLPVWSSSSGPESPVTALALDPSGKWLALGTSEGVRIVDFTNGNERMLPGTVAVRDLSFDAGGRILFILSGGEVRRWDLGAGRFGESLAGPDAILSAIAASPGTDYVAAASDDGAIHLWREGLDAPVQIPAERKSGAVSLQFSPENEFLAGVIPGLGPRVWFPDHLAAASAWTGLNETEVEKIEEGDRGDFLARLALATAVTSVAVSPDGLNLATGTRELEISGGADESQDPPLSGSVVLWDAAGATVLARVSPEQRHKGAVTVLAYRNDGTRIASGSTDGTIKLWVISDHGLRLEATLNGHVGAVNRLIYAPSGKLLASAGVDGTAKIWSVSENQTGAADLHFYIEQGWYALEPEVGWKGGTGFAGGAREAIPMAWSQEPPKDRVSALLADAVIAAAEKRWRRVALRVKELDQLGTQAPENLLAGLKSAQPKAAATLGERFSNGEGIELLWCPATGPEGFTMGELSEPGDYLRHQVVLTQGFWLAKHETTQAQYAAVMGRNPSSNLDSGLNAPVENLSWDEALEFCRRLTDRERARGMIPPGWEYRLPTEAQWEYACRAGTDTRWSFGDDESALHRYANFNEVSGDFPDNDKTQDDGHKFTAPTGSYLPNPWGFHDMHGNVFEWCLDAVIPGESDYPEGLVTDPFSAEGPLRIYRGGGFSFAAPDCRSAYRGAEQPSNRGNNLGLRPALVPSGQTGTLP